MCALGPSAASSLTRASSLPLVPPHPGHANIIGLKDVIVHPQHDEAYLIMELMDTDMHRVIQSSQELTDAHFKHIMYQILSGLRYAHRSGVMHRDLKPANILLDRATNAKLADFGLSRAVDADVDLFTADAATLTTMTAHVVTRWYRAPELMLSADGHYSAAVDIWSVGCILAELLLRKPLWPGNDFMDQLTRIFATTGKPSAAELDYVRSQQALDFVARLPDTPKTEWTALFPHANPKCLDLLDKMLTFHPKKRINVEDAMNHPYFDSVRGQYEDLEPELPPEFNFDFEKDESLTLSDYRQMIVEEAVAFKKERMEMARLRRERRGK